jgi:hypothetical protein
MRPSVPDVHITDSQDEELSAYRAVAGLAVAGLIFGLLAPLALIDPTLWTVPALGMLLSVRALRRIRRSEPALAGRKLALAGLALSLLFLTAAPTDWLVHRWRVRNEATELAGLWFRCLTEDEPQKAYQLTLPSGGRQPLDHRLWAVYRDTPRLRQGLENYVKAPLVRTLLALGPKARVRFYETANQSRTGQEDVVEQLYAVTYEEEGERKSFFVAVQMSRTKLADGTADWRIARADGGVRPEGW